MSNPSIVQFRFESRSMGTKLIIVCGLACLMIIPALLVWGVITDRTQRAAEVMNDIAAHVGGQQTFLGPTLAIPYAIASQSQLEAARRGMYFVFPARATAVVNSKTEVRRRSLFKVPVFQADLKFNADFDLSGVPTALPEGAVLDWNRAEIVIGISDARGALTDAVLNVNDKTSALTSARIAPDITLGANTPQHLHLALFGAGVESIAKPGAQFSVSSTLRFSGAQRLALLAYGKTTHYVLHGDWPNPSFDGGFLTVTRDVSRTGFNAEWSVPSIARGVRAEGCSEFINGLESTALGTSFVELTDPYQSVNRSMKYVPLFLGLVFLSYFLFEVSGNKLVHPAQYVLVGVAQIIFYLLLLSLAERIGFDLGFLIAGTATVTLLSLNAGWIFESRRQAARGFVVFSLLYGLIYLLLRLEDNALLVGSIASFIAVAAVMYFSRKIDWYGALTGKNSIQQHLQATPPA